MQNVCQHGGSIKSSTVLTIGASQKCCGHVQGIVMGVPFVDCLTTMLDASIPLTVLEYEEWGNPNEEKYYQCMKQYSPIDNVSEQVTFTPLQSLRSVQGSNCCFERGLLLYSCLAAPRRPVVATK
jgi:protease II